MLLHLCCTCNGHDEVLGLCEACALPPCACVMGPLGAWGVRGKWKGATLWFQFQVDRPID